MIIDVNDHGIIHSGTIFYSVTLLDWTCLGEHILDYELFLLFLGLLFFFSSFCF